MERSSLYLCIFTNFEDSLISLPFISIQTTSDEDGKFLILARQKSYVKEEIEENKSHIVAWRYKFQNTRLKARGALPTH